MRRFLMRRLNEFALTVEIEASVEEVWREIIDWQGQSEWMLATKVYDDIDSPVGVGHRLRAFTGLFAKASTLIGVMDEMVVSQWQPPNFTRVEHIGKIIKGYGTFTLTEVGQNRTKFDWFEVIDAPNLILALIKIPTLIGVLISLRRFKKIVESKGLTSSK